MEVAVFVMDGRCCSAGSSAVALVLSLGEVCLTWTQTDVFVFV
jgi:hypothetical protein